MAAAYNGPGMPAVAEPGAIVVGPTYTLGDRIANVVLPSGTSYGPGVIVGIVVRVTENQWTRQAGQDFVIYTPTKIGNPAGQIVGMPNVVRGGRYKKSRRMRKTRSRRR